MKHKNHHTGGTFGTDIRADGSTLGICVNGTEPDQPAVRAEGLDHFDRCSLMLVPIPPVGSPVLGWPVRVPV